MSLVFSDLKMSVLGTYTVCWWDGTAGQDVNSAYLTDVGSLVVAGPAAGQSHSGVINALFALTIQGTSLTTQSRIYLIESAAAL